MRNMTIRADVLIAGVTIHWFWAIVGIISCWDAGSKKLITPVKTVLLLLGRMAIIAISLIASPIMITGVWDANAGTI